MQPNKHKNFLSGFTLLELLLVILIMGVISTATFSLYRQYSLNAKINTTAQQMQAILQAGSSFYIDTGSWPSATDQTFKTKYLTFSQTNPWGNNFSWGLDPVGQKKFQVLSGAIPTGASPGSNPIAQRIVDLLPAAVIAPNDANQVLAEITIPKKKIAGNAVANVAMINQIGTVSNGQFVSFPSFSCPTGWAGTGVALPWSINLIGEPEAPECYYYNSRSYKTMSAPVTCTGNRNVYSCSTTLAFQGEDLQGWEWVKICQSSYTRDSGTLSLLFIGWCYKTS